MAASDYMRCVRCNAKAYYDADTDYGDAQVIALCLNCAQNASLAVVETFPHQTNSFARLTITTGGTDRDS